VDELAAVIADSVVNGSRETVLGNAEMVREGRGLLAKR
jgi:hypothetical protein